MHLRKISEKNKFLVYIRNSVMDSTLCFNFKVCSKSIRYFSNPICFFFFFLVFKNFSCSLLYQISSSLFCQFSSTGFLFFLFYQISSTFCWVSSPSSLLLSTFFTKKIESQRLDFDLVELESLRLEIYVAFSYPSHQI